ncbi:MAG: VWA domain-containing protein [Halobacteriales archaeon]
MAPNDGSSVDGLAGTAGVRQRLVDELVTFVRALRDRGAAVPADATLSGARALAVVGLDDRDRTRAALRAALVSRREDLPVFDELFDAFWRSLADDDGGAGPPAGGLRRPEAGSGPAEREADAGTGSDGSPLAVETERSSVGARRAPDDPDTHASTAVYSPTGRPERVEAGPGMAGVDDALAGPVRELTAALAELRGRRWSPGTGHPDVRRALRESVETGGAVVEFPGRDRRPAAVRGVLLVDVSRSVLDTVDRGFLVSFVRAVREAWRDAAVFFFDTSVREVGEAFDARTPGAALEALEAAEAAWGGGTRIGQAVETVRRDHPTLVDRETVVLVISDGLEVGEIDRLERELAGLSRRAGAVLWANPLAASPDYEPTCRGMAAARPYLDGLFAFAGPDDVAEMARQLARHGPGDRVGYEHDGRQRAPESDRSPGDVDDVDGRA